MKRHLRPWHWALSALPIAAFALLLFTGGAPPPAVLRTPLTINPAPGTPAEGEEIQWNNALSRWEWVPRAVIGGTNVIGALAGKQPAAAHLDQFSAGTPAAGQLYLFDGDEFALVSKNQLFGAGNDGEVPVYSGGLLAPGVPLNTNSTFDATTHNTVTVSNTLNTLGPFTGTTGELSGSLHVVGGISSDAAAGTRIGGTLSLMSFNREDFFTFFGVKNGNVAAGAESNLWQQAVPNNAQMKVKIDVLSDAEGDDLTSTNELEFVFERLAGGSATLVSSNAVHHTNNLIRLDGDTVYWSAWAPAGKAMSVHGYGLWMTNVLLSTSFAPVFEEGFEGVGAPALWTPAGTGRDYDYSADPLSGTESLIIINSGTTVQAAAPAQSPLSEAWVSFEVRVSGNPTGLHTLARFFDAGSVELGDIELNTDRTLTADHNGGRSAKTSAVVPTTGKAYAKMRWKAASISPGGDAEMEVWLMTNPASGWGTGQVIADGTSTASAVKPVFHSAGTFGTGFEVIVDKVVWSNVDIPASYYE